MLVELYCVLSFVLGWWLSFLFNYRKVRTIRKLYTGKGRLYFKEDFLGTVDKIEVRK
jgi:hypothetical protein